MESFFVIRSGVPSVQHRTSLFEPPQHRKHITAHERATEEERRRSSRIEGRLDPSTSPITVQWRGRTEPSGGVACAGFGGGKFGLATLAFRLFMRWRRRKCEIDSGLAWLLSSLACAYWVRRQFPRLRPHRPLLRRSSPRSIRIAPPKRPALTKCWASSHTRTSIQIIRT